MLFTRKELAKIIVPLMIEQLLAISIGIIDSMMVSSAGEAVVSGVSLVDTLNLFWVYLFSALAGGGAVVISQFIGKKDYEKAAASAKQLIWVVFLAAATLSVIVVTFKTSLLKLIFGKISDEVMANARIYLMITALSYPFLGIYNSGAAIFRAMGNSKISMVASIIMNIFNVFGNALLIFVFQMGAAGAAIATLFARFTGAVMMLILVHNKKNIIYVEKLHIFKPDKILIKKICGIGIPNGLENSMFQFGKVMTQSLISTFGTVQIAANAVGNALATLQYVPGNAIGLTMITVIGRCVGAGEKEQAKKYAIRLLGIAYTAITIISLFMWIFAEPIVSLYGLSYKSSELACELIILHCLAVSTVWPSGFTLPNSFRAASDVKFTMVVSVCSMWVFRVGLSYVFALYFNMGVKGVWYAMFCDWTCRAMIFMTRYIKGVWLKYT